MPPIHVFNVCQSSHTAVGVRIVDATDNSGEKRYPDYRPVVTEISSATSGKLLYKKTSGVDRLTVWTNGAGQILEDHEEPVIYTVHQFYEMFGGAEFCQIK